MSDLNLFINSALGKSDNLDSTFRDDLKQLIHEKKVIICCGCGGVGKTTISAAIALAAATEGKKTIVITIDPARRLATSLGLKELGNTPVNITPQIQKNTDVPVTGQAFAIMPENSKTFENLIRTLAQGNDRIIRKIFKTSIYKIFAQEFSGTNEYLAMEKLHELYEKSQKENGYDLIVLDTPPSANTLSFLQAPRTLADFFDDRVVKWFVSPGSRILAVGIQKLLAVLEKLTGHGFIAELIEFTTGFFELKAGFLHKIEKIEKLLKDPTVSFLMVTSCERLSKEDTQGFVSRLKESGYPFWGFIVNKVLSKTLGLSFDSYVSPEAYAEIFSVDIVKELKKEGLEIKPEEVDVMKENFKKFIPQLNYEYTWLDYLKNLTSHHTHLISEQPQDVHSIEGLVKISTEILEPSFT